MICSKCHDLGFTYDNGVKTVCFCTKFRQLCAYAPGLVKSLVKTSEEDRKSFSDIFDDSSSVFLRVKHGVSQSTVDTAILYWLLKNGQPIYSVFNVYELVEIYFHNHPGINSLFDLKFPAVVLCSGYEESVHGKQTEITLQVLEILRSSFSKCLYVSVGRTIDTVISDYFKTHSWKIIDVVGESSCGSGSSYTVC